MAEDRELHCELAQLFWACVALAKPRSKLIGVDDGVTANQVVNPSLESGKGGLGIIFRIIPPRARVVLRGLLPN